MTDISGSSDYIKANFVTYSNDAKKALLDVKDETLKIYGAVSEQCAREMSEGLYRKTKADIVIATTGIAGPTSDNTNKPVGLVYIAFSDGKSMVVKKCLNDFSDNIRENNRNKSADTALETVLEYLI